MKNNWDMETKTKLNIVERNYIQFKYDTLSFEVLGNININSYTSLYIMLVTNHGRIPYRANVDLLNHDQRIAYINKASEKIKDVHRDKIILAIDELLTQLEAYKKELRDNDGKPTIFKTYQLSTVEREQAIETLKQPKLLNVINTMIGDAGVIGNEANRMLLFLTYLTRKTKTSLHAIIQSEYNYLQQKLGLLIPDEEKKTLTNVSDSCLFYYAENELQNKVLLVEDTISNRKQLLPLIGFQTNNLVTKTTVIKNEHAQLVTVQKHVRGNVSLCISTREEQAFSKNGALSFVIHEETGSIQDEKVLMYQRKQSAGLIKSYNEQKVISQIQNLQRVLSNITVRNPFAMEIQLPEQIKNKQITNLHYLRFIEVITFLKQHQLPQLVDEETGEIYIETTIEDIKEANQLLSEIMVNKSDALNKTTRLYLEQLKRHLGISKNTNQAFTLHEVSVALQVPKTSVVRYNKTLVEMGFIMATGEGNKKEGYKYQLVDADEYKELKSNITSTMDSNIISIEKYIKHTNTSEPKITANQNESGTLNVLKNNTIDEVNHNPTEGTEATTKKSINPKKKVA